MQHAHGKGVIHRDIKPTYVLVTVTDDRPVPKVIDFGIAKATQSRLTERTLYTAHRQLIRTPQYMSPEQADSDGSDIDTRTDVYSLGVVLYELLIGVTPHDAVALRSAAYEEMRKVIRTTDVEAINGGHPPAIVFSPTAGGKCREIAARGGMMFGPFPESRQLFHDRLDPGETLSLFTDGHFEVFSPSGEMLDIEGFCDLVGEAIAAAVDSSSAADAVVELTDRWQKPGDPRDDRTLTVVRRITAGHHNDVAETVPAQIAETPASPLD